MKHRVQIRRAVEADANAIADITAEAFEKYALDLGSRETVCALYEKKDDIISDINTKYVYIGFLNGTPVGSIRFEIINGVSYISRFGVKLIAQGCGMGRALVKAVKEESSALSLCSVALHTSSRMASLIRFYYGQGFFIHSTSTHRGYIRALLICELQREPNIDYRLTLASKE
ncbi:MAG: GNAT family N-acetyltransferase [Christensenellales bacterium]|jgi:GNAT superfamily N-acetyltransferase